MRVKVFGYTKPLTILEIKQSGSGQQLPDGSIRHYTDLVFKPVVEGMFPESTVEVVPAEKERVAQVRAAIAYQNTLTKAGTPRKHASRT
jgi:hypothetical protein